MNRIVVVTVCLLAVGSVAWAVEPITWTDAAEADFAAGELTKAVVSSLGEVRLARALETLVKPDEEIGMISALAVDGKGTLFVATSPQAKIFRLEDDKLVELASLPGVLVRSMIFVKNDIVAGVCGSGAGLYRIDRKGQVTTIWTDPEVTFVWSIVPGPAGCFYVATGAKGRIYKVAADGKAEVVYDSDDDNILSMAAGANGLLYAGTGENGLVIEVDPAKQQGRILYDSPEKEISGLVIDADGVLYAATSDSTKASADGEAPSKEVSGKPDKSPAAEPASQPASMPTATPATGTADTAPAKSRTRPGEIMKLMAAARGGIHRNKPSAAVRGGGNAVYRIDTEGFVREIFRRPVTILAMTLREGVLTLGTGHGGQVFTVDTQGSQIVAVTKVDPKDVTVLAADARGRLYLGTAGAGGVFALEADFVAEGTFVSKVRDATQIARWGTISVRADVPAGCGLTVATRSGNVAKPDEKTWSNWTDETAVARGWMPISCPAGRFFQYRLTLSGGGKATAVVTRVQSVHQVGNLAPTVSSIKVTPSSKPTTSRPGGGSDEPMRYRIIKTKAADPNGDDLKYAVYFRRAGRVKWIELVEKSDKPLYVWDTLAVGEATYEVRVEVSDAPANPLSSALTAARVSRPIVVDNSPPEVTDLTVSASGDGQVSVVGKAADAGSRISRIDYAVDTNDEWVRLLPADGISDSQEEAFSTTISDIEAGAHRIAIRITDEYNNAGYASVEVTVGK